MQGPFPALLQGPVFQLCTRVFVCTVEMTVLTSDFFQSIFQNLEQKALKILPALLPAPSWHLPPITSHLEASVGKTLITPC